MPSGSRPTQTVVTPRPAVVGAVVGAAVATAPVPAHP